MQRLSEFTVLRCSGCLLVQSEMGHFLWWTLRTWTKSESHLNFYFMAFATVLQEFVWKWPATISKQSGKVSCKGNCIFKQRSESCLLWQLSCFTIYTTLIEKVHTDIQLANISLTNYVFTTLSTFAYCKITSKNTCFYNTYFKTTLFVTKTTLTALWAIEINNWVT